MNEDDILAELENSADPDGLLSAYVATCDSGNCDMLTSALVWIEDDARWVSMCFGHAIKELAAPFLPEY